MADVETTATDTTAPDATPIPKSAPPSDADVNRSRTEKARATLAAKRAAGAVGEGKASTKGASKSEKASTAEKEEKPVRTERLKVELLRAGCQQLVAVLWWLSRGLAWLGGGTLRPLTDKELDEGAKEADALVSRFPIIATVLAFAGLPLWLVAKVTALWESRPDTGATAKPQASTSNVTQLRQVSP